MKSLLPAMIVVLLVACGRSNVAPISSPFGAYLLQFEISGEDAGPILRGCVKLIVRDVESGRELSFQTKASDHSKWAAAWASSNTIVIHSSDVGTYAYEIVDGRFSERPANADERKFGRSAYAEKYGGK